MSEINYRDYLNGEMEIVNPNKDSVLMRMLYSEPSLEI